MTEPPFVLKERAADVLFCMTVPHDFAGFESYRYNPDLCTADSEQAIPVPNAADSSAVLAWWLRPGVLSYVVYQPGTPAPPMLHPATPGAFVATTLWPSSERPERVVVDCQSFVGENVCVVLAQNQATGDQELQVLAMPSAHAGALIHPFM